MDFIFTQLIKMFHILYKKLTFFLVSDCKYRMQEALRIHCWSNLARETEKKEMITMLKIPQQGYTQWPFRHKILICFLGPKFSTVCIKF